jgi:hypothetical protein
LPPACAGEIVVAASAELRAAAIARDVVIFCAIEILPFYEALAIERCRKTADFRDGSEISSADGSDSGPLCR